MISRHLNALATMGALCVLALARPLPDHQGRFTDTNVASFMKIWAVLLVVVASLWPQPPFHIAAFFYGRIVPYVFLALCGAIAGVPGLRCFAPISKISKIILVRESKRRYIWMTLTPMVDDAARNLSRPLVAHISGLIGGLGTVISRVALLVLVLTDCAVKWGRHGWLASHDALPRRAV